MEMRELSLSSPVVVVHAHPDDETLTSGGLLATLVAGSVPVTLVTCTRGEQGEVIGDDPLALEGDPAALGVFRELELVGAMAALGVEDHLFLDQILPVSEGVSVAKSVRYADSGMSWVSADLGAGASAQAQIGADVPDNAFYFADLDKAARLLAGLVVDRHARTLVTYEPGGGYGHPDHVRAHQLVARTQELLASEYDIEVQVLVAIKPTDLAVKARAALLKLGTAGVVRGIAEGGIIPSVDEGYGSEASHEPAVVNYVRTANVAASVFDAMMHHKTQIKWVSQFAPVELEQGISVIGSFALSNDIIAPVLSHEFYCDLTKL